MRIPKEQIPVKLDVPGAKARQLSDFGTASGVIGAEYFSLGAGTDIAPLLQGLEGDLCQAPHWGYMISGDVVVTYADGSDELYDMVNDPNEWTNVASKPENAAIIAEHKKWLPKVDLRPAPNSASRVLTYDKATDEAVWEGKTVKRSDPIPE